MNYKVIICSSPLTRAYVGVWSINGVIKRYGSNMSILITYIYA